MPILSLLSSGPTSLCPQEVGAGDPAGHRGSPGGPDLGEGAGVWGDALNGGQQSEEVTRLGRERGTDTCTRAHARRRARAQEESVGIPQMSATPELTRATPRHDRGLLSPSPACPPPHPPASGPRVWTAHRQLPTPASACAGLTERIWSRLVTASERRKAVPIHGKGSETPVMGQGLPHTSCSARPMRPLGSSFQERANAWVIHDTQD